MPNKDLTIAKGESPKRVDNLLPGYTFQRVSRYTLLASIQSPKVAKDDITSQVKHWKLGSWTSWKKKNRDCMTLEDKKLKKTECVFFVVFFKFTLPRYLN
uniref:Uncharacterized protein n=1 Tax=Cacopsylla melanoneura TaxID=428564 RepID=A0A8D8LVF0_9HEMI